jgi:type VI secretion system protein ImpA
MSTIELERLLQEISSEAPSGPEDLEYDPAFMELKKEIQGRPAVEMGGNIIQEAIEPNWLTVKESALELLARTHDLRVAVSLTRALLRTDGLPGLYDGLSLLHGYVERYWDTVYPQLDPEENNNPMGRVIVLETLNDWDMVVGPLTRVTICSSRAMGNVNLRKYRIAIGKVAEFIVSDEEKASVTQKTVEGAFADCSLDELKTNSESVSGSLLMLCNLEAALEEKVGSAVGPDLKKLHEVVGEIDRLLKDQLLKREPSEMPPPEEESEVIAGPDLAVRATKARSPGRIDNRDDVLNALNQICTYYEQFEPASPVPLLLKRAMRLVKKSFLEIMQDLAPDSVGQIELLCGKKEGEE